MKFFFNILSVLLLMVSAQAVEANDNLQVPESVTALLAEYAPYAGQCRSDGDCLYTQICKSGRCTVWECSPGGVGCSIREDCVNGRCRPSFNNGRCSFDSQCRFPKKCRAGRCS